MKFAAIFFILTCTRLAAFCQHIRVDTDRMETLIGEWNFAHNARTTASFEAVYDDTLLFYTETLLEAQAIALKQRLFRQNPSFQQRIRSDITYTPYTSGVTKCDFTKEVLEAGGWKQYPSYLLISYEDNAYVIVGESDYATDKTLRYRLNIGEPMMFENTPTQRDMSDVDSTFSITSDSFFSSLRNMNLEPLDSVMLGVDPLKMFPELSSMGMITVPRGYVFVLIAFLSVGGIMIFVADMTRSKKRRYRVVAKKPDKADRVIRDFKMQSVFEAFVITLFDPLYFRHRRPRAERVLAGSVSEGETGPDLEFEFNNKDTHARFAIKCLYFKNGAKNEVQLFSPRLQRQSLKDFEELHETPLYFVLGFGGAPDDPKELFLLPAREFPDGVVKKQVLKAHSKSGMFFYNRVAGKLQ